MGLIGVPGFCLDTTPNFARTPKTFQNLPEVLRVKEASSTKESARNSQKAPPQLVHDFLRPGTSEPPHKTAVFELSGGGFLGPPVVPFRTLFWRREPPY